VRRTTFNFDFDMPAHLFFGLLVICPLRLVEVGEENKEGDDDDYAAPPM
jgi:hypothetical protein